MKGLLIIKSGTELRASVGPARALTGVSFNNLLCEDFSLNEDFVDCKFTGVAFKQIKFEYSGFSNCTFHDCQIEYTKFKESVFTNCVFTNCLIQWSEFFTCELTKTTFGARSSIWKSHFSACIYDESSFHNCLLCDCKLELALGRNADHLFFSNCSVDANTFHNFSLIKSTFTGCEISGNIFSNSPFSKKTFADKNTLSRFEVSHSDLHTLSRSEELDAGFLYKMFGITDKTLPHFIEQTTKEVHYQSCFISYSFKDREFTKRLNESLLRKGVKTFLWEKDAPAGRTLKEIMSTQIHTFEKVLFIASEHSIKSAACQYELSEARYKQDKLWQSIYIPIHLDDFLFKIKKDEVRPLEKREEYWKNIEGIREFHCIDFSPFRNYDPSLEFSFDQHVGKIFEALKK
jgi:uncharacterized protein YjbI with pentapeptide repeats